MEAKTSKRRVNAAKRRAEALSLRAEGRTFAVIAECLGITTSRAHQLVTEALDELMKQCAESAALVVRLELERLDMLLCTWLPRAVGAKDNPKAAEIVMRIMARRAKLLGLDAPERIDTTNVLTVKRPAGWGEGEYQEEPEAEAE